MDQLVLVALAANRMEADIIIATLESEGIAATWRSAAPSIGLIGGTFGPIEILVLSENRDRAHELLEADDA